MQINNLTAQDKSDKITHQNKNMHFPSGIDWLANELFLALIDKIMQSPTM
jgi:hypothetical protein